MAKQDVNERFTRAEELSQVLPDSAAANHLYQLADKAAYAALAA